MLYLTNKPLKPHYPQSHFLGIISTGDPYAIASKGNFFFALEGRWVWKWKDFIDRKWMNKYTVEYLPDKEKMMNSMKLERSSTATIPDNVLFKGGHVLEAFRADPMVRFICCLLWSNPIHSII
jgi:hypothetical protein